MSADTLGVRRSGRLAFALVAIACGSTSSAPPYGQLQFPAGLALVNGLLLVSSQDDDALHVYDTRQQIYVPAPSPLLPLSIPTVRRPGLICSDGTQAYVLSSTDPLIAVVDAENDPTSNDPPTGLRELGQVQLRSMGNALSCGPDPQAVLQYKIDAGGSPAGYEAALANGSLDSEREAEALVGLPAAALIAVFTDAGRTVLQEVTNDSTGTSPACRRTPPIVDCGDGGASPFCMGPRYFCPGIQDLMTLPPQDPFCNPVGPPRVFSIDLNGSSIGAENLGHAMVGPLYANLLAVADANSNCIGLIDLDDQKTTWVLAGGPTVSVSLVAPLPNTCVPGGSLLAAVLAPGGCDASFCGGVVFIDVAKALADPLHGRLPAPVPYPFTQSPDVPEAPVRVLGFLTSVTWTGSNLVILGSSVSNSALINLGAEVGNGNADLTLIEIGMGLDGGGTAIPDGGSNGYVTGTFPCPPNYLAPRLIDINDYAITPVAPAITTVAALDPLGNVLQATIPHTVDQPLTKDGALLPTVDRLGQAFPLPVATVAVTNTTANCYGIALGSEICFTDGVVQHGVAQDEIFTVRYQGALDLMNNIVGAWDAGAATVTVNVPFDVTTHLGGVLTSEAANLGVTVAAQGLSCDYGIAGVTSSLADAGVGYVGTLTLVAPDGGTANCPPSQPQVAVTVFATGAKPYTVEGTASGFVGLWPNDGHLQFVASGRWQYPRNLVQMLQQAEQLSDLVLGVPNPPLSAAPNSTVTYPRPDGGDEVALNSAFGLALYGALGPPVVVLADGGIALIDAGGIDEAPGVIPQRGASWTFLVSSGVVRLVQTSLDAALIETMTSQIDSDGGQHVYASCRGGDAVIDAQPANTLDPYTHGIFEIH